jgi:hypothetical protein
MLHVLIVIRNGRENVTRLIPRPHGVGFGTVLHDLLRASPRSRR